MKAMVLTGIRQMEIKELADPQIKAADEVLIELKSLGVCGSDIHYYRTGRIGDQVVSFPFTLGHECAGVVKKTGDAVTQVSVGDRVAIDPAMWCGSCDQCMAGRQHTCRNLRFLGCPGQAEGALSEMIVMPEKSLVVIDDHVSMDQAALSEPLSIGYYAVKLAGEVKNKKIGILGFGPIGMSVLKCLQVRQPAGIYVSDLLPERIKAARDAGAVWSGHPEKDNIVKTIHEREPLELDVVFECCGQQEAIFNAEEIVKPGGRMVIVGIPETDTTCFRPDMIRRKELTIINVRRQVHCVEPSLELIASGKVNIDDMITHRFSLADTPKAFDLVDRYADGVMKAIIDFTL